RAPPSRRRPGPRRWVAGPRRGRHRGSSPATVASPAMTAPPIPRPMAPDEPAGPVHLAGPDDRRRAAAVARLVARGERAVGGRLDGLRVWALAGGRPEARPDDGPLDAEAAADPLPPALGAAPDGPRRRAPGRPAAPRARADGPRDAGAAADRLAPAREAATDGRRRRAQGLHVTPRWLAELLVDRALPAAPGAVAAHGPWPTVCDPACGGGAVLLAAARHLHRLGVPRRAVVRDLVRGADIDPVGLAAAEAALALWAGEVPPPGRLVVGDPLHAGAAVWADPPAGGFGAVVGNPPFQCQLDRATARGAAERRRLRARYGPAVRAYTDTAWLFLLAGCELVR